MKCVLIKNMEMPENCGRCRLNDGVYCNAWDEFDISLKNGLVNDSDPNSDEGRPEWCPLIETEYEDDEE